MAKKYIDTGKCHEGLLYVKRRVYEEDNGLPIYVKRANRGFGYRVEAPDRQKTFSNTKYTEEENLAMALEYLETGNFTPPKKWHVRKDDNDSDLPKYIMRYRTGFMVQYYQGTVNGKRKKTRKTFLSKNMSDDEKLNLAKIYLDDLINGTNNYQEPNVPKLKKSGLPQYIYKSSHNGYFVRHYPSGICKSFGDSNFSEEENLSRAIDFLNTLTN